MQQCYVHYRKRPSSRMTGVAYLSLLILIAIIGIAAAATVQMGAVLQRREAEQELLAIGSEFHAALISYAKATPKGLSPFPHSIQDLLKDPRYPEIKRHLRRLYVDPITDKPDWGVVFSLDGTGIIGIHSLSTAVPIKMGNFEPMFQYFETAHSYSEWIFRG